MTIWNHQQEEFSSKDDMKKMFLLFFTIFSPSIVYCQNLNFIHDEYGPIYIPINDSTIIYNTKKGQCYEVKLNQIYYNEGDGNLKKFLKEEHCKPDHDDDYAYRVFFFILFNSDLIIKEIRGVVLPLSQYTRAKKKRVKLYTKKLKRTKNKWNKKTIQDNYVYFFSFVTD